MKQISLTQGKFTLVDDEDYDWLMQWKWYAAKGTSAWYASRVDCRNGGRILIKMHRLIMTTPKGMDTDHINSNGLDNRKDNLRICSRSEHHYNRKPRTGQYKGIAVSRDKWQARITIKGKRLSLGYYDNKEDAARAYDKAARRYVGLFVKTNFQGA